MNDLSACIMTRVSHDLAGLSGALHNTVELMEIDPTFAPEATNLLKESTAFLMARVKFFRSLFGLPTAPVTTAVATDYLKTLTAPIILRGDVDNLFALGAVFVCAHALIRGGEIVVDHQTVAASGQIHLDETSRLFLNGQKAEPTPAAVGAAWLAKYAEKNGITFKMRASDKMMLIEFVFNKMPRV